jgi:ubiquinone/menaquinone biosynthesis C-methylase UbiE
MIKRARNNAKNANLLPPRVAFVQASLTKPLPIASNSIDCVLSNCVINLLPLDGKASLLKEVYRVLKPGGRLFADDVCTYAIDAECRFISGIIADNRQAEFSG